MRYIKATRRTQTDEESQQVKTMKKNIQLSGLKRLLKNKKNKNSVAYPGTKIDKWVKNVISCFTQRDSHISYAV